MPPVFLRLKTVAARDGKAAAAESSLPVESAAATEAAKVSTTQLARRAALNAVATLVSYAVKTAVIFVVTPLLVSGLGRSLFGAWEILNRLALYTAPSVECPSYVLQLYVAEQQYKDDPLEKQRRIANALAVWLRLLPITLIAGGLAVWLSARVTHVSPPLQLAVQVACGLLVFRVIFETLALLPSALLYGMNLSYRAAWLQTGITVAAGVATAGAVLLSSGLVGIAAAQTTVAAVGALLFWLVARQTFAWFRLVRPMLKQAEAFWRTSLWNCAAAFVSVIQTSSDVLILGAVASPALVSQYVLTDYLPRSTVSVVSFCLLAVSPGFGGLIGSKELRTASLLRRQLLVLSWCLVTGIGATTLAWNRSFVSLWVGASYYSGFWVNLVIVLRMVQSVLKDVDHYIIDSALQLRLRVIINIVTSLLSVGLAIVLTRHFGVLGLCLGIVAGRMVQSVLFPFIARACLGERGTLRPQLLLRPAMTTALLFILAGIVGERMPVSGWSALFAGAVVTFLLTALAALFFGFPSDQRALLLAHLRQLLKRAA